MMTMFILLFIISAIVLVLVAAVQPHSSDMSMFELERTASNGDPVASETLRRERLLPDILSLQQIVSSLLLVMMVIFAVCSFGWILGAFIALIIALEYGALARLRFVSQLSNAKYEKYESDVVRFIEKFQSFFRFVRTAVPKSAPFRLRSKEELVHLVEISAGVVTHDEKKLIVNGLDAANRTVEQVMTPRSVVDVIDKKEHLGPLVLDDLHKTGHSRFPVVDKDIDHVVGVLHVRDLLEIDARRKSTSVEKAMDPRVYYIKQTQSLEHALAAFLRTRHHLFIVINEFRETVGIITLEDVVEALLGRKIVDEFDTHEDLRKVAARNPRENNHSQTSVDV